VYTLSLSISLTLCFGNVHVCPAHDFLQRGQLLARARGLAPRRVRNVAMVVVATAEVGAITRRLAVAAWAIIHALRLALRLHM